MNSRKITSLGNATANTDAVNKTTMDTTIAATKVHDLALATATLNMNT